MGIMIADAVFDAALDKIATCTRLDITSDDSTPVDLTNTLANMALTAGDGNGDYAVSDGDVSGRKLTVTEQSGTVSADGTAKHYVLSLDGVILYTTTCVNQVLTSGNLLTVPAFDIELRDPVAE